jgi:hypothetical protein
MTLSLRETHFPTTRHLTLEVTGVETLAEALYLQALAYTSLQTDSVGAVHDTETDKLTLQAFVHSDVNY